MPAADKMYETTVASRLLESLGSNWRFVEKDRESPDFVISDGTLLVGLELCAYREQGVHNQTFPHDDKLKRYLYDKWLESPQLQSFALNLFYRSMSNGLLTIPKSDQWEAVFREIETVISSLHVHSDDCDYRIYFALDDWSLKYYNRREDICFSVDQYPCLARHFRFIDVHYRPDLRLLLAHSSASAHSTGADTVELSKVMTRKIAREHQYRTNIPRCNEIWLLIHSDGWPPSARIADDSILHRLLNHASRVLSESNSFDRAYWLDNAYVKPWGPLCRIT